MSAQSQTTAAVAGEPWHRWVAAAVCLLFVGAVVRTAWLGDDAHITLRSIHNWLEGHGLVWNANERVSVFTHPLWACALAGAALLTGELYYSVLGLQIALSAAAVLLVLRLGGGLAGAWGVLALTSSLAFVDYCTSGLENPLTYVLVALFVPAVRTGGSPLLVAFLAALLGLTRTDHAVLVLPALLVAVWPLGARRAITTLLIGFTPVIVWELVSVFYYGSLFGIPAYAKAFSTGIPTADVLRQGLHYYRDSFARDPITLSVIALGLVVGLVRRRDRVLAIGVVLYLAYVLRIGGCFMSGRFFATPFLIACLVIAAALRSAPRLVLAGAFAAVLAAGGVPLAQRLIGAQSEPAGGGETEGVWHDRSYHHDLLGLLSGKRTIPEPDGLAPLIGIPEAYTVERPGVMLVVAAGISGLIAGPRVHCVDPVLLDPLLARLPAKDPSDWKIGHVMRRIPEGYYETVATGENRLHHPELRRYYDDLRLAVRAPLLAEGRLAAIWRLVTGSDRDALRAFVNEDYYTPPLVSVRHRELGPEVPDGGLRDFASGQRAVYDGGLEVRFDGPIDSERVALGLDVQDHYAIEFRRGDESLGFAQVQPKGKLFGGILRHELVVPEAARGFDTMRFAVLHSADGIAVVGWVTPGT